MADVRRNKALAAVLQEAKITDESGRAVDLSALDSGPTGRAGRRDRALGRVRFSRNAVSETGPSREWRRPLAR